MADQDIMPIGEIGWWDTEDADEVEGYDLIKGNALNSLVGVPFMVVSATFHEGVQRKGIPYRDDFVSLEVVVAPFEVMKAQKARILGRRVSAQLTDPEDIAKPGERVVINDGSTGIYRQIVQYLSMKGLIELPDGPLEGPKGECVYDLPRSGWLDGGDETTFSLRLKCPRGLRYSEYNNEYTTPGERAITWYLA